MSNSPVSETTVWDRLEPNNIFVEAEKRSLSRMRAEEMLDSLAAGVHEMMDKNGFWDQTNADKLAAEITHERFSDGELHDAVEELAFRFAARVAIDLLTPEIKLAKHMLVITEVAELSEGVRKPGPSDHIPDFTLEEEETVDALVRLLDYAGHYKLRLGECFFAKMRFNGTRPYKHGKAA